MKLNLEKIPGVQNCFPNYERKYTKIRQCLNDRMARYYIERIERAKAGYDEGRTAEEWAQKLFDYCGYRYKL